MTGTVKYLQISIESSDQNKKDTNVSVAVREWMCMWNLDSWSSGNISAWSKT